MPKGKLITIYGVNNIGKSTHAKRLVRRLSEEGFEAVYVKYPVYELEPTGSFLNKILRSGKAQEISEDELQMWFVLNRYQFQTQLNDWLKAGKIVIAEDYIGTGIAWGVAKGLHLGWAESMNRFLKREDFAILMEGNRSKHAIEKGHIHEENEDLIAKCIAVLERLADRYSWKRIPVQKRIYDTEVLVWKAVDDFLKKL